MSKLIAATAAAQHPLKSQAMPEPCVLRERNARFLAETRKSARGSVSRVLSSHYCDVRPFLYERRCRRPLATNPDDGRE